MARKPGRPEKAEDQKKVQISITLQRKTLEMVDKATPESGTSRSSLIDQILRSALNKK